MVRYIYTYLFLTVLLNFSCGQHEQIFFRSDYRYLESVGNFYKFHTIPKTWVDAKQRCEWEGATLYYPTSEVEYDAVQAYATEVAGIPGWQVSYWIGISSLLSGGVFVTTDGLSMVEVYNKWTPGKPEDLGGGENCAVYSLDGMTDVNCWSEKPYICKKTHASLAWNTDCQMPHAGYIYNETLGKCYKFHVSPENWTDAYAICNSELSYLAIIDSQDEADFFVDLLTNGVKQYHGLNLKNNNYYFITLSGAHLGLHNKFGHGWKTVKDTPLENIGYRIWDLHDEWNFRGRDAGLCGGMLGNGHLDRASCDRRRTFICEHDV